MCCRRAAAALLPHLSLLIAVLCGAALVACVAIAGDAGDASGDEGEGTLPSGDEGEGTLPSALRVALGLRYAAPLGIALAHLAQAALQAPAALGRGLLVLYAVCGLLLGGGAVALGSWALAALASWLQAPAALPQLAARPALRAWLRPLLLLAAPHLLPQLPQEESVQAGVVCALCACALAPLLQLAAAALALCALPPRRKAQSSLRRSSSVYYEPSAPAPHKTPLALDVVAAWE